MSTTDTEASYLLHVLVWRLGREHAAYIAGLSGLEVDVVEAVLQVGLGLAFYPLEVAAATDDELCAHLTALLRFVFTNPEAEFYRPPDSKEQCMPKSNRNDWDPDWKGASTGEFVAPPQDRVRRRFKPKPDSPFPPPPVVGEGYVRARDLRAAWDGRDEPVAAPVSTDEND